MGSHDFIKFPPALGEFSSKTWLLLGEIQAKIERIREIPIPPDESKMLRGVYLAKGLHGTTAIEGNSFSEAEVSKILDHQLQVPPSRQYQEQEIRNMINAFNQVGRHEIEGTPPHFSVDLLNQYHRLVLDSLEDVLEDGVQVGRLRTHSVLVGRYRGAPPELCEQFTTKYCEWLNNESVVPQGFEDYSIAWQIIRALVAHLYFAWIHPYGDGNGRMARLIEFAILLRAGVPDMAAHLLTSFYNKTVDMYYRELQASHGESEDGTYPEEGDCQGFIKYALQGYRDELNEQLAYIHYLQLRVIWHDFIHSAFPKHSTSTDERRKRLALDLTDHRFEEPTTVAEIRELTAAVALLYADKKDRTIKRDLDVLVDKSLLRRESDGYKPNTEILLGFFANARHEQQ